MAVYKPNAADKKIIRAESLKLARAQRGALRVSLVDGPIAASRDCLNALLVSKDGTEAEAIDQISWADFCKRGVELTDNGDAIVDILVYDMPLPGEGYADSLRNYAKVIVQGGKLSRVTGERAPTLAEVCAIFA